jgi:hypothetical protein
MCLGARLLPNFTTASRTLRSAARAGGGSALTAHKEVVSMSRTIFAYLDAGTGSMIVQVVLGGLASVAVALKLWWRRILRFLGIRKDDDEDLEQPASRHEATEVRAQAEEPVESARS